MAKKKIVNVIKLQIKAGQATPAPPIGPALGAAGVNIMGFCKEFNGRTQDKGGKVLPTVISVYQDKSFEFITKDPPVAEQIKERVGGKGSSVPNRDKVGRLSRQDLEEIAKGKIQDMNAASVEAAMRTVAGTARSMGVDTEL